MVSQSEPVSTGSPFATDSHSDLFEVGAARVLFEDASENERYTRCYDWTWCIKLSPAARTLYAYLRYRAGSSSKSWPERIVSAEVIGVSERKIHDLLHELEINGLIEIESHRKECKPSDYIIKSKASVAEVQRVLQNLQDPRPLAESARTSRKSRKTHSQILPLDKGTVDTAVKPTVDTESGAAPPRARSTSTRRTVKAASTERISTEQDVPDASPERRLALDLCQIFGWKSARPDVVDRFEGYYRPLLDEPFPGYDDAEGRLLSFNNWLASNGFWKSKGKRFKDASFSDEWDDWVGQDEPAAKPRYVAGKPQSSISRAYRDANGGA